MSFPRRRRKSPRDGIDDSLKDEIRERGVLTFARFMERALYAPGLGYHTPA